MKTAIALGTFDGLHAGHRAVLAAGAAYEKRIAVTFSRPPKLYGRSGGQLMTLDERKRGLTELGITETVCLDFKTVKDMPPDEFLKSLLKRFDPALISCGYDFRFGRGAAGDTDMLKGFCAENCITLSCVNEVKCGGKTVSSSLIRGYIENGEIKKANELLYYKYGFCSAVIKGDMRGRTIGFPTVNQLIPPELALPRLGVYKSSVSIDGKSYTAVSNIGYRPTYKTESVTSETHIIGFSGDLYGKEITVYPERFLRSEKKFSSINELEAAIKNDISEVLK